MNAKKTVREFLMGRRARVQPNQVGLPALADDRRVPGLRREEVAVLAGVSLDYYTRLERGNITGASDSVLHSIADALLLNEVERAHLFDLARPATAPVGRQTKPAHSPHQLRASVQRVIDTMEAAAVVQNPRQDIVAANELGRVLYAPVFETASEPNIARFIFLDPRAPDYYVDWLSARQTAAAMLRLEAGRNPLAQDLTQLIGELSTRSAIFRHDWAAHHVHAHQTGTKSFRHPDVGPIAVEFNVFEMPGEPGLMVVTYGVEPGTPAAAAWSLLTAKAATQQRERTARQEHHDTNNEKEQHG